MTVETVPVRRRRRRVHLTPTRSLPVEFTGARSGAGPLTFGQLNTYLWLNASPGHVYTNLWVEFPVPEDTSVADVAEATAALIGRHESLRTTFVRGEPPSQRIAAAGVQLLEVCSLGKGPWDPLDRLAVADALIRWLRESADLTWRAMRIAVAVDPDADDRVIACAAGFVHLAADHGALGILTRDFADLLGTPRRQSGGRRSHQPLDQVELEATPTEQRRAEAALDYLREQMRRLPRCLYALPGARPTGESLAVEMSSAAAALAVQRVAARTRASRSSIVLAAVCAVVARRAGYRSLAFPLLSHNRFERHLVDYVGSLAQGTLATVEIGERSFDELVRHTWAAVLEASRHGRYDGSRRADPEIGLERGVCFNYDPLFNSLVSESWSGLTASIGLRPGQIDAALTRTGLQWRPMPRAGTPIRFTLHQIDGLLRLDAWSDDTGLVPRTELESVLLAVERLLVAAAPGDLPSSRIPESIGLEPLAGTADRVLVDSSWVELADVQRVVDEAFAPAVARVFAPADGGPLVARLVATEHVRTPEEAHARCMDVLAHHPTAITPGYYVLCAAAPDDPADPAAWPVPLVEGTGRGSLDPEISECHN